MEKSSEKTEIYLPHMDDFLLDLQSRNFSLRTIYNYERDLKIFTNFLSETSIPFEEIDKKAIINYKAYLNSLERKSSLGKKTKKALSSLSINRILSSLRSYLKFLIKIGFRTPIDPSSIELVKTEQKIPRVGEFQDILKLIEAPSLIEKNEIVAIRNRAILETLFSTGVRISELLNIKISDIDKEGRIFIRGKGKKERFVYLTPRAQRWIRKYLKLRNDHSPYLFVPLRGKNASAREKKISANYIQEKIKMYREILSLNIPITPHGFRRAFATYLAERGANPNAIQILLGHESLHTTTRYVQSSHRYAQRIFKKYHPLKD